jgi:hypothetical protein
MKVDWRSLKNKIPNQFQIGKAIYEVVWIDEFKDPNIMGETRFDPKQIVIKKNMSPKLTVITATHEYLHAYSNEFEVNLTENQILASEKGYYFLFKMANLLKEKKKRKN